MIDKTFLKDEKDFLMHKKKYWTDTQYNTYMISKPEKYPCVAIMHSYMDTPLRTIHEMELCVYPDDFNSTNQ